MNYIHETRVLWGVCVHVMKMEIRKKVGFLPMVGFDPTTSLL